MEFKLYFMGEYPKTYRYGDPFVGEVYLPKDQFPAGPPERITLKVA